MAKLECSACGFKQDVPTVCCGPGVPNKTNPNKLDYPAGPAHGSIDMPKHCGRPAIREVINKKKLLFNGGTDGHHQLLSF